LKTSWSKIYLAPSLYAVPMVPIRNYSHGRKDCRRCETAGAHSRTYSCGHGNVQARAAVQPRPAVKPPPAPTSVKTSLERQGHFYLAEKTKLEASALYPTKQRNPKQEKPISETPTPRQPHYAGAIANNYGWALVQKSLLTACVVS